MAQHAAERLFQVALGESGLGRAGGQHRAVDEDHPIAKLRHAAEVMGGDQDQVPLVAQRAQ